MKELALIFVGGGLGSMVRYMLARGTNSLHAINFPFGTLVVNVVACFTLGLIVGLADHKNLLSSDARIFWTVGVCGGFSTFSTFAYDGLLLFQQPALTSGLLYVFASVVLCLGSVMLGIWVGR